MNQTRADDYARARLEYLTAGRPAIRGGPRHAHEDDWLAEPWLLDELDPDEEPQVVPAPETERAAQVAQVVAFGRQHARALGVVALIVCLVVAVFVLRAGSRSVPLEAVALEPGSMSTSPGAPTTPRPTGGPAPGPSASTGATPSAVALPMRVHVLGAVRRPGVVTLPTGARVADALAKAGGLLSRAAPGELNLAAPLADGDQVVIGTTDHPRGEVNHPGQSGSNATGGGTSGSGGTSGGPGNSGGGDAGALVNLNTATAEQLDSLPGVGPVTAQHILDWREQHQRFSRVEELQEVDGIGPKTYAQLSQHVTV